MSNFELFLKQHLINELDEAASKLPTQTAIPLKPVAAKCCCRLAAAGVALAFIIAGFLWLLLPHVKANLFPLPAVTAEQPQIRPTTSPTAANIFTLPPLPYAMMPTNIIAHDEDVMNKPAMIFIEPCCMSGAVSKWRNTS